MNHGKKRVIKYIALIAISAAVILGISLAVWKSIERDGKAQTDMLNEATAAGIEKAKAECTKEGLSSKLCATITGSGVLNECDGKGCWIVHTGAENKNLFRADVTVALKDGRYVIIDYLRDTGEQD